MIVFEVKLICPTTKEVIFHSVGTIAKLPPEKIFNRLPRPLLIITTRDSAEDAVKKAS